MRFLIIFLISFFVQNITAQPPVALRFDRFTQNEGLSNNHVHCIFQDSQGWMWFGTTYGLNRFDGRNFRVFKNDFNDPYSLSANLVRVIFEDSRGIMWVGTENGGLCRYDRENERFLRNETGGLGGGSVNDVVEDGSGNLWVASSRGLVKLTYKGDGKFQSELVSLQLLSPDIKRLYLNKTNQQLWIGTERGVYRYELLRHSLLHLELPNEQHKNDEIWAIYGEDNGKIWIGSYNAGLFYVNPWEDRIMQSAFKPEKDRAKTVRAIIRGKDGRLWLGTRAGLYSLDIDKFEYHSQGEEENRGNINSVLSLFIDAKGDMWIGSRQGISYFVQEKQFLTSFTPGGKKGDCINDGEVYAFLCEGNNVWIGTEVGGVNKLDTKTKTFTYYTCQNTGIGSNCVKALLKDGNQLWVGMYMGGISVLDIHTGKLLRQYSHNSGSANENTLLDNRIWTLFKDKDGTIWVGNSRGLQQYDRATDSFITRSDILRSNQVNWISQDTNGDLWIGCEDELIIYDILKKTIKRYFRKTRYMAEFPKGTYYVTTIDGLGLFDKERGFYKIYTEKDGLVNNYTQGILQGNDSTLWISTTGGLSQFDLITRTFKNFKGKDGLQDNQFNYGAYAKDNNGNLLFGGINGFNVIAPVLVRDNRYIPPVVITDMRVFNESVKISPRMMKLRYNQNMLSFSFTALNYVMAEKNSYRYRLDGLENRWVDAGHINTATYTNLKPGSYVFRVLGSNNDGIWNTKGASLHIEIVPPFWETWWFSTILYIVIALIVFLTARLYVFRQTMKNRLEMEHIQAKRMHEVDMLKLQFFTNVSHEIRTPLTLIIGPISKLYREIKDHDIHEQLSIVYKNANNLLKLVNQLLDFRKLDAGQYQITYQSGDIVRFLSEITNSFEYSAKEKDIKLLFETNKDKFLIACDQDKIEKIMNNLLSNALKFTNNGGQVNVSLNIGEDVYEIKVSDTGLGMTNDELQRIFNRFYRSPNAITTTGTGIGLSITKSFVELMDGTIDVKSEHGKGTTFSISLPFQPAKIGQTDIEDYEAFTAHDNILLVVDDNEDIRLFIKSHFKNNYNVIEATNGKEGYEKAVENVPDIIIADMLMPEMNGLEMCKELKNDERTSHIPILMLTAVVSKETELEVLQKGVDDYITKPFDINILNAKVDNLIKNRLSLREKMKIDFIMKPENVVIDSPDDKFLKKAVDVVEKFMDDPELDIEKFSEEMGVSRMQLYRKFEALANMTVKEFIRGIRLKRAAQLLEQQKLTISEIAWAVGFKDLSYFRKCFKEEFGETPSEYIKRRE
ncbi:MAG: response regulator [Culturomica sp.]|jgi:signal transduction histidine kinase/ligand-binding sensor domain-containing protein/DNA-binding response OmpR family regulator|nr:response regulator [Culturomica sp.]